MDLSAIFPDAVIEILEPLFYFRERIAIQRAAFFNTAGGQILLESIILNGFIPGKADFSDGWPLCDLHHQRAAIAQDLHVLKVAAGVQGADRITDILVRNLFSRMNRHAQ